MVAMTLSIKQASVLLGGDRVRFSTESETLKKVVFYDEKLFKGAKAILLQKKSMKKDSQKYDKNE